MQKKPALEKGIKNLMRIIDQSLTKAATYLCRVDEPTYNRMRYVLADGRNGPEVGVRGCVGAFYLLEERSLAGIVEA